MCLGGRGDIEKQQVYTPETTLLETNISPVNGTFPKGIPFFKGPFPGSNSLDDGRFSLLYPLRMAVAPSLCQSCGVPVKRGMGLGREWMDGAFMAGNEVDILKCSSQEILKKTAEKNRWIFGGDDPIGLVNGWFKLPKS